MGADIDQAPVHRRRFVHLQTIAKECGTCNPGRIGGDLGFVSGVFVFGSLGEQDTARPQIFHLRSNYTQMAKYELLISLSSWFQRVVELKRFLEGPPVKLSL